MPDGMPQANQIQAYTDDLAALLKAAYAYLGTNAPGETGTLAALANAKKTAILGDGVTSYGLGAPAWQSAVSGGLASLAGRCRYDLFFSTQMQPLMGQLDNLVKSNLPMGWQFRTSPSQAHAFDFHLSRLNAISPQTPPTPTLNATLSPQLIAGGQLPSCVSQVAPRVVYTLVGAVDYVESLPSPEAPQVALSGSQSGYIASLPGNVPTGVYKARIYRTLVGGASGAYYYDQDVQTIPGQTFPLVSITAGDASLRQDIQPPQWMSAMLVPEAAALFALAFASSSAATSPLGFGLSGSASPASLMFGTANMLSPLNVLAGPSNGYVGVGNQPGSVQFGVSHITGTNAQTYTPGAIQAANVATANIQGYAGSTGVQARITAACDTAPTLAITYNYLAAPTGQTIMTDTASAAFTGAAVGAAASFGIPAGRLVLSATVTGCSGGVGAGTLVNEPSIRAY